MNVEQAVGKLLGHGVTLAKVGHIETSRGDDSGNLGLAHGVHAGRACTEGGAGEFICPLGGGDV